MRISDWSSDVCSSDLVLVVPDIVDALEIFGRARIGFNQIAVEIIASRRAGCLAAEEVVETVEARMLRRLGEADRRTRPDLADRAPIISRIAEDRQSVAEGKRGSIR